MIFNCPHCDQQLEAEDEGAGLTISCPSCNQELVIPEVELLEMKAESTPTPEPPPQPRKEKPQPPKAAPAPPVPESPKKHKQPSTAIRWILFLVIVLGIGAAVYFSLMAPGIIPRNPPDNPPTQTPSGVVAEEPKPAPSAPPADNQQ
jgi:hypothetical protein